MTCWYPWFLCNTEASYVTSCFIRGVRFYTTHIVDVSNNCHISPHNSYVWVIAAQKMKFFVKDFFSKCDQIRGLLRIWSHFTEDILNGKLHFLFSDVFFNHKWLHYINVVYFWFIPQTSGCLYSVCNAPSHEACIYIYDIARIGSNNNFHFVFVPIL